MITSLILTIIVLLCLGLILGYAMPPIGQPIVLWAIRAIAVLIAIAVILRIWAVV